MLALIMLGGALAKMKRYAQPSPDVLSTDAPPYSVTNPSMQTEFVKPPPSYYDSTSPPSYEAALAMPFAPIEAPPYEPNMDTVQ